MKGSDYNEFLAAIKSANDAKDKETLAKLRNRLLADYGLKDDDVQNLLKKFRYSV